ncbi:MAG TPA: hypothetical protein P5572_21545 [Phycisphaerae bacterium]|nr:hypothetical protein [Phycisphaerales bacterium]HRX87620.1 hypothetical protein [Phycisphaerae bacterium]
MATDDLRNLLSSEPFRPFRVHLTSGGHYDVRDPELTVLMKSRLFLAVPNTDRSIYIPYLHIAALETLANGRKSSRRGPKRDT